jgi:predicted ATPase/class 3 adenylate cyclase
VDGIGEWLQQIGLEKYIPLFAEKEVTLDVLPHLTEADIGELGLPIGARRRLIVAIHALRSAIDAQPAVRSAEQTTPAFDAERRQLTVMFCDLVGSTELATNLDPEQLRDLMQAYQRACSEVIERYEGHVAQYLGDGLMVYFGWPRAHEDDAVRAVRAGLDVMEAVSRLNASPPIRARVGIHTGLVVVGQTGEGDASIPKAAVGDTPNIAARLQALADAGAVVVSGRTQALAGGLFEYTDLGSHALKGVPEPVRVCAVTAARAVESRFEAFRSEATLTPLVGREEEIALLLRRWQEAKDGEGQVVLVGGEPGVGKSRLVRTLRERLAQERYTPLRYQYSPYHINSALYAVIEHIERAAGFTREDTPEQKLDKMQAVLAGSASQVAEAAPLFASMLSLPVDRYPPLNLSPQKQKEKTLEALAQQVEALARRQALLMIYEDAHWIDPTSQEALDLLVSRLRSLPVLLIVTYRPEYTPKWSEHAHVTLLGLSRLARRQGAELVSKLTGGRALPQEVLDQILAHSDGVPLFVEELTKSVLESGLLRKENDLYSLQAPLTALSIPTTLRDSLVARLDRLAPIREIAQIGACIGREFSYRLLDQVSPLKGERLHHALDQLTQAGMVFRRGTPPDATYTFKHALVQDAAYDSLLKSKRSQLHAQIARVLEEQFPATAETEPEVLARHYTAASDPDRAVAYWLAAAQLAFGRFANTEAIADARKGLDALQALPDEQVRQQQELPLQITLAWALASAKGYGAPEVGVAFTRARELCDRIGQSAPMFPILSGLWIYWLMRARYRDSGEMAEQLLALGQRSQNSGITVSGHMTIASNRVFTGDFSAALEYAEAGLERYNPGEHQTLTKDLGFNPGPICADWSAWANWLLGYPDRSHQKANQALDLAEKTQHPFTTTTVLVHNACLAYFRRTPEAALDSARATILVCNQVGIPLRKAEAQILEGWALTELGQAETGIRVLENGLSAWLQMGTEVANPLWFSLLALAYQRSGRIADARRELSRALEAMTNTGETLCEAELHRLDAIFRLDAAESAEQAEHCLHKAIEVSRTQSAKSWELRACTSLALLWKRQGKTEQARNLLTPVYSWFTEGFDTNDLREARALLEELVS